MNIGTLHAIGVGVGFAIIFVSGYVLRRTGRPYGSLLLNVHKLLSVALLAFVIWRVVADAGPVKPVAIAAISLSMLSLCTLIGTGGALSAMSSPPAIVRRLHRALPYIAVVLTISWLLLH